MQWRMTLQFAATVREKLTAEQMHQIANPQDCAIGRWLAAPETTRRHPAAALANMHARHQDFHDSMTAIARCIESGAYLLAESMLQPGSRFGISSQALALAISTLDRDYPLAIAV